MSQRRTECDFSSRVAQSYSTCRFVIVLYVLLIVLFRSNCSNYCFFLDRPLGGGDGCLEMDTVDVFNRFVVDLNYRIHSHPNIGTVSRKVLPKVFIFDCLMLTAYSLFRSGEDRIHKYTERFRDQDGHRFCREMDYDYFAFPFLAALGHGRYHFAFLILHSDTKVRISGCLYILSNMSFDQLYFCFYIKMCLFYDSKGSILDSACMNFALAIIGSLSAFYHVPFDIRGWHAAMMEGPRESLSHRNDCGVFICMMAYALCTGKDMKRACDENEMENIRRRLALILSHHEVTIFFYST